MQQYLDYKIAPLDGVTPDGTPRNVTVSFYLALAATYYTIAAVGILFTFVCLIFNVKYRNTRYASSYANTVFSTS